MPSEEIRACGSDRESGLNGRTRVNYRQPLRVIKDINGRFTYDNLALFPDSLVLVKGSYGYIILRSIQLQFGALGALLLYPLVKRSQARRVATISKHSPGELARLNPKNRLIGYDRVVDAQLKKSLLTGRLTINLADGTTQKLTWPKGTNKYEQVAPLLRQALGTKLSEVA